MSKVKKVLAMILSMAMILGMSLTAFAAPTGKITVTGADGATLRYAKIVEEDRNSVYGWDFTDAAKKGFVNAWLSRNANTEVSDGDRDQVIAALIELGKLENVNNAAINGDVFDQGTNAQQYAAALQAVSNLATEEFDATEGIDVGLEGNGIGLYLITASKTGYTYIPMAAYVGTTFSGVKVEAKGAKDQIKKTTDDGQSVMTDDIINYTVTVEYPYYPADAKNKTFVVTDTLTNAKFVENSLSISGLNTPNDYTVEYINNGDKDAENAVMSINFNYNNDKAGDILTITYKAKVGDLTGGAQVSNEAKSQIDGKYTTYKVVSDSAEFKVIKTDDDEENPKKLPGAVFTLYVADSNGNVTLKVGNDTDGYQNIKVRKVIESDPTDSNGETVFKGLDVDQTYYVKETTAPEGYTVNDTVYQLILKDPDNPKKYVESEPVEIKDDNDKIIGYEITQTWTVSDYADQPVKDSTISSLPSTGGIGTTIFTIGGCAIMIAAAGLFFASRKKESK